MYNLAAQFNELAEGSNLDATDKLRRHRQHTSGGTHSRNSFSDSAGDSGIKAKLEELRTFMLLRYASRSWITSFEAMVRVYPWRYLLNCPLLHS